MGERARANWRVVRLAVTTTASFANTWLVQRLGAFNAAYPDIEITVETRAQLVDLRRDYVDVAIRHGLGRYPGHASFRIWTPSCGPSAARGCSIPPARSPRRPTACRIRCCRTRIAPIGHTWLRAQGIDPRELRGASFSEMRC